MAQQTVYLVNGKRFLVLLVLTAATGGVFWGQRVLQLRADINDRVERYGRAVQDRLSADFERIHMEWPPNRMVLIGIKDESRLEVWVSEDGWTYALLKSYPILAASGGLGPKLQEGDRQVPEGLYRIESLNPNSRFHLSLRVNYPNAFDRKMAAREGRTNLGGDIMIHGSRCSIGCLAMGDPAAEELFVLAAEAGVGNISLILSPVDFRKQDFEGDFSQLPDWAPELYEMIKSEMKKYESCPDDGKAPGE